MHAFNDGVVIRSGIGLWLAILADAAPRGPGGRRLSPLEVERRVGPLQFVARPTPPSLLVPSNAVAGRRAGTWRPPIARRLAQGRQPQAVVMFLLVPQIRLAKRLDVAATVRRWRAALPELVDRALAGC